MKKNKIIKNIAIVVMILAFVSSSIISKEIGDLDEIWNYNMSNIFAKGLNPYIDYSTVVTPLLQILAGLILKIFPNELITMRILAVLLISGIVFLIYKILDLLKINDSLKIVLIIGIMWLEYNYFCIDYNYFSLFLTLIIILLEIKYLQDEKGKIKDYKYNLVIGILAGLVLMTKQTIGIFVSSSVVGYMILLMIIDKFKYKKDIKIQIKNILFRILGIAIPVIIFVIYLLITKSLDEFINYAILGIKTFSNKIEYINLLRNDKISIKILSIIVPISFIINFVIAIAKKDKRLFVISCLAISMFIVAFPISDNIHFLIGSTTSFIAIVYNINNIAKKIIPQDKKLFIKFFIEGMSKCMIVLIFIFGIYYNYKKINNVEYYSQLKHYKYIPISENYEQELKTIEEYIQKSDKKVYILNFDAALYMIPLDIYNKDYDMFMKGNFGVKGEQGIIEKIQKEDAKYLIVKDGIGRNWQNPEDVRKYIKENMKYKESISKFDVFENY